MSLRKSLGAFYSNLRSPDRASQMLDKLVLSTLILFTIFILFSLCFQFIYHYNNVIPIYDGIWLERRLSAVIGQPNIFGVLINASERSPIFDILLYLFSMLGFESSLAAVQAQLTVFFLASALLVATARAMTGSASPGLAGILLFLSAGFASQTTFGFVDLSIDLIGVYLALPLLSATIAWCVRPNAKTEALLSIAIFLFLIGRPFLVPAFLLLILFVVIYLSATRPVSELWRPMARMFLFAIAPGFLIIILNIDGYIRYIDNGYSLLAPITRETSFTNFLDLIWASRITPEATITAVVLWALCSSMAIGIGIAAAKGWSVWASLQSQDEGRLALTECIFVASFPVVSALSLLVVPFLLISDQPRWYFMAWSVAAVIPFCVAAIASSTVRSAVMAIIAVVAISGATTRLVELTARTEMEARANASALTDIRAAVLATTRDIRGAGTGGRAEPVMLGGFLQNGLSPTSIAVVGQHRAVGGKFDVGFELLRAEQFGLPALANWDVSVLDNVSDEEMSSLVFETLNSRISQVDIIIGPASETWPDGVRPHRPFLARLFPHIRRVLVSHDRVRETSYRVTMRGVEWSFYKVLRPERSIFPERIPSRVSVALGERAVFPQSFTIGDRQAIDILLKSDIAIGANTVSSRTSPLMPMAFGGIGLGQTSTGYSLIGGGQSRPIPCDPMNWCRLTMVPPNENGALQIWINGVRQPDVSMAPSDIQSIRVGRGFLERDWQGEIGHIAVVDVSTPPVFTDLAAPIEGSFLLDIDEAFSSVESDGAANAN
jgi:hypothetical protein